MVTTVFHHPSFSSDDKSVVFATTFGAVIWRPGLGHTTALSKTFYPGQSPTPVNAATFSPNGKEIATGQLGGITLWRVPVNPVLAGGQPATPSLERSLPLSKAAPVVTAAFSPGGRFVAAGDTLGRIRVWNVTDHTTVRSLRIQAIPTDLGFSVKGHRLLIGATDGTVRVWDWHSGVVLAPLQAHAGATRAAQYVPGHPGEILSAGDDGLVEISQCPTCVSVSALRTLAERHLAQLGLMP
jgi:WD40 repeat protein